MPDAYLFAYGTLRPDLAPATVRPILDRLAVVGPGTTPGFLFGLGVYPGAVFAEGAGPVHGTVWQLPPDDPAVWAALDAYEGVPDLYVRRPVPVRLADGRRLTCWAYQYNRPPADAAPIPSGRYAPEPAR